jgi:O-antigen biosynthesis protein WbqP
MFGVFDYNIMCLIKRCFVIFISLLLLLLFSPLLLLISLLIVISSPGPILFWSNRIGCKNVIFKMPKFRTMHINAPIVATHLLANQKSYVTNIGKYLRKYSLDELPQLFSIIFSDMTFVGPRPALYNQDDLVELRTKYGVHKLKPGITGWAQINGRDELSIKEKVILDKYYLDNMSFVLDIKILFTTFFKVIHSDGVSH